jgi:hypothetical protein
MTVYFAGYMGINVPVVSALSPFHQVDNLVVGLIATPLRLITPLTRSLPTARTTGSLCIKHEKRIAQLVAGGDKRGKAERGGAVLAVSYRNPPFCTTDFSAGC